MAGAGSRSRLPVAFEVVAARELLAVGNRRNCPLFAQVFVLAIANLLMHLQFDID